MPIMKPVKLDPLPKWNPLRFALFGACAGLVYALWIAAGTWGLGEQFVAWNIGGLFGGVVGGAFLAAAIAGLRNLLVR